MKLSRRSFVKSASAAALAPRALASALAPTSASSAPMRQLNYAQVELLDGPLRVQFDHNRELFLALNNDSLLKPFRQLTGMPAPGEDMGGWYSPSPDFNPPQNMTGYVPGHTFGQYMSGLARAYAATGDARIPVKIDALVTGYAATVSPKFYQGYCLPCYTFDKINCGLIDAHAFANNKAALAVLSHATDAVLPFLPDHALTRAEMRARPHPNIAFTWDEPYTLPENFYLAYQRSGDPRYHALARRYLQNATYFQPLANGENVLPGTHAYSHVNALSSAMQAYFVDGSTMHLEAAHNGFRFVREQSFATGGWGPNETFRDPKSNDVADSLTSTHASFETPCGAYGHFKIARYLLTVTGDPALGDSMENVLYNTILGARLIQPDGVSFYYSDYNNDGQKSWYGEKWPCCSGTFPQITADYGISSYFATPHGLAVNLYTPSRVHWKQGSAHVALTQQTSYPHSEEVAFALQTDRDVPFTLQLRIPAWATSATRVSVNGRALAEQPTPGTWFPIHRTWKNGDRIELTLGMSNRLLSLDAGHPNLVALAHGPQTLFAILPSATFTRDQLLAATHSSSTSPDFLVTTDSGTSTFKPFPQITDERYRLYHQV